MDPVVKDRSNLEEWYRQNAKQDLPNRPMKLLYSEMTDEQPRTVTDRGVFFAFLRPEESKSGKPLIAVCRMTTVYVRDDNGDPGELLHSETVVLHTLEFGCYES